MVILPGATAATVEVELPAEAELAILQFLIPVITGEQGIHPIY
jgi:hypothetical protein